MHNGKSAIPVLHSEILADVFGFLHKHRHYNHAAQTDFLGQCLSSSDIRINALRLLHMCMATGRQVQMNVRGPWMKAAVHWPHFTTFAGFLQFLNHQAAILRQRAGQASKNPAPAPLDLFEALLEAKFGGPKTCALLVRSLLRIAHDPVLAAKLWPDLTVEDLGRIRLPVDIVIETIFGELAAKAPSTGPEAALHHCGLDFKGINGLLLPRYPSNHDMLLWDDLWFWGYITQRSAGNELEATSKNAVQGLAGQTTGRLFGWNENKFWMTFYGVLPLVDVVKQLQVDANAFVQLMLGVHIAPATSIAGTNRSVLLAH